MRKVPEKSAVLLGLAFTTIALFLMAAGDAQAQQNIPIPRINIGIEEAQEPRDVAVSLQILFLLTILALAPSILIMMTSFTRIIIVLQFARRALTTQEMPPTQVLVGLALFLTFFVMAPTFREINDRAVQPFLAKQISQEKALQEAWKPLSAFMFRQTNERDLGRMWVLAGFPGRPNTREDIPWYVLVPAFVLSELRVAFTMGVILYIPFIVIDMIVASVLMSMGMIMLPPIMISLPFKILIFIMADGWNLLIGNLVESFR
ncbi:MAG: flagellar type III secretion system pore protein FliP [bacterium]